VGLLVGAASAPGGVGLRDTFARSGPLRHGSASALVQAPESATLPDDATGDPPLFLPPSSPRMVGDGPALSSSAIRFPDSPAGARFAPASYRARAPPAA